MGTSACDGFSTRGDARPVYAAKDVEITLALHKALVRPSLRTRWRNWWRRQFGRREIVPGLTRNALEDAHAAALDRALLYGDDRVRP